MPRGLIGLSALLAAALLWAYLLTHPIAGGPSETSVQVWSTDPRDVSRLVYKQGKNEVVFEPQWESGRGNPRVWVHTSRPKPRSGKVQRSKSSMPQPVKPELVKAIFKGNAAAENLLKRFFVLSAKRSIGKLESLAKHEFGLPAANHTLRLELRGERQPLQLEIGGATYGDLMRYVLEPASGSVFLFRHNPFRQLGRANSALFDRSLFPLTPKAVERIRVSSAGASKELWKLQGSLQGQWGYEPQDDQGRQEAARFVDTLSKLKVVLYLLEDIQQGEGAAPAMEIELFGGRGNEGKTWLRLFPRDGGETLARSSYTGRMVRVSHLLASRVLNVGSKLLKQP
ncbi:MAG: DUF4340 domain-containing protein [SAR324 cluster bacterium]|nr:DUF4340 domain-containing protein [SAR324 cluster bacterium]